MGTTANPPTTWEELVALQDSLKEMDRKVLRLDDEDRDYTIYRQVVPTHLQYEVILQIIGERDYAVLVNRYPYSKLLSKLPQVTHWSLWNKTGAMSDHEIEKVVTAKFPGKRFIAVESTVKSMPEIWHTHVFVEERVTYTS